jgi:hypothetical protein
VYQVDGGNISWYYKGTGKPASYQLKVYPKGASKEFPDSIVANVWNWDKNGKLNGGKMALQKEQWSKKFHWIH